MRPPIPAMLLAPFAAVLFAEPARAERPRVTVTAPIVELPAVAPGAVIGGRVVEPGRVDPDCLVTRGTDGRATTLFLSRAGENPAVMTPAFGACAVAHNPYPARIIRFDRVRLIGNAAELARGSLRCVIAASDPNTALCNRPLRCDLAKPRCLNP